MIEYIEKIALMCFATKEESEIDKKIDEYVKSFPHLRNPASMDMLRQAIKSWVRIRDLERLLPETDTYREKLQLMKRIDDLTKIWMTMMSDLGLAFTKQQYIKQKNSPIQLPIERLKMLQKKGKET